MAGKGGGGGNAVMQPGWCATIELRFVAVCFTTAHDKEGKRYGTLNGVDITSPYLIIAKGEQLNY